MSRALVLEAFGDDLAAAPADFDAPLDFGPAPMAEGAPEAEAEPPDAAYERGYRAGWDDCERQAAEARQAVGAELARNLQELGFTYHEARSHVLGGIAPLLEAMVGKVLPQLAAATLGASIVEELAAIAETAADAPVTILVSPDSHDRVAGFLAEATALPHRLVAEETLADAQVFFRLGEHERQLDLGAAIARIGDRLAAFTDDARKVLLHG